MCAGLRFYSNAVWLHQLLLQNMSIHVCYNIQSVAGLHVVYTKGEIIHAVTTIPGGKRG